MINRRFLHVTCTLFFLAVSLVNADVTMKMETRDKSGELRNPSWAYVGGTDRLRIDYECNETGEEPQNSMIFRADRDSMYMVDHKRKEYTVFDRESVEAIASQMNEAMRQMNEQLAQMPPEQREMMEKMLKGRLPEGGGQPFSMDVRDMGIDQGYRKYEVWVNSEKQSEVWTSTPSELGISQNSLEVFKRMAGFFSTLMKAFSSNPMFGASLGKSPFAGLQNMQGFPVRTRNLMDGSETRTSVESILAVGADAFEIPSRYKERKMRMR
jgi:hypothetical protein